MADLIANGESGASVRAKLNGLAAGWQVIASRGVNPSKSNTTTSPGISSTTRVNFIPSASASMIVFVYANMQNGTAYGEYPGLATVRVRAAHEASALGSETSETGVRTPAKFEGEEWGEMGVSSLLFSDPIAVNVTAGVPFFARSAFNPAGAGIGVPQGCSLAGGTGPGASNNGDSQNTGADRTYFSTTSPQMQTFWYAPIAVLGWTGAALPSVGILGDSIADGPQDSGYIQGHGGYQERAVTKQLARVYAYPTTPHCGHVKCAASGSKLTDYLNPPASPGIDLGLRTQLMALNSTIWSSYGTNDLFSVTLAQMKLNYVTLAVRFMARKKKFIQSTLLPIVTTTDGCTTLGGQSTGAQESKRTAINDWLRDTSASGFVAQAVAAAGAGAGRCAVFDAAAVVEVNAAGALTLNGGFWNIVSGGGTPRISGTLTAATAFTYTDTSKSMTQDAQRGYVIRLTSGTYSGQCNVVYANSPTAFTVNSTALAGAPSAGNTYDVIDTLSPEGTHPSAAGAAVIGAAFPLDLLE